MGSIPFAYSTELPGTEALHLNVGLQVSWSLKLTGSGAFDVEFRAERKKDRVCSEIEYQKAFDRLKQLPRTVEHLVVQLGMLVSIIRTVVVLYERLEQGSPSHILEWFSWRMRSIQSLTRSSILERRGLSVFLGSSISLTLRQSYWMTW